MIRRVYLQFIAPLTIYLGYGFPRHAIFYELALAKVFRLRKKQ